MATAKKKKALLATQGGGFSGGAGRAYAPTKAPALVSGGKVDFSYIPPRAPISYGPGAALTDAASLRDGYVRFVTYLGGPESASLDVAMIGEAYMLDYQSGWDTIQRDGSVDATVFRSSKPLRQAFPIVMDRLSPGEFDGDVENAWNLLERLFRPPNGERPPVLRVVGGGALHQDRRWFIDSIDTDPEDWVRDSGRLVQIQAVVTLQQHVTVDVSTVKRTTAARNPAIRDRTYAAVAGEDWYEFAKRTTGSKRNAKAIASFNKVTDPHKKLKEGKRYKLPPFKDVASKGARTSGFEL